MSWHRYRHPTCIKFIYIHASFKQSNGTYLLNGCCGPPCPREKAVSKVKVTSAFVKLTVQCKHEERSGYWACKEKGCNSEDGKGQGTTAETIMRAGEVTPKTRVMNGNYLRADRGEECSRRSLEVETGLWRVFERLKESWSERTEGRRACHAEVRDGDVCQTLYQSLDLTPQAIIGRSLESGNKWKNGVCWVRNGSKGPRALADRARGTLKSRGGEMAMAGPGRWQWRWENGDRFRMRSTPGSVRGEKSVPILPSLYW